jgi:probable rRNA maturation factor
MFYAINSKSLDLQLDLKVRRPTLSSDFIKRIPLILDTLSQFIFPSLKKIGAQRLFLNVTICGDQRMRTLNAQYRQIDRTTDVLSFPIYEHLRSDKKEQDDLFGPVELGDIIVSWPKVIKQAVEFGVTQEQEFVHLLVHGYLHLLGYDHEVSKDEEVIMEKYEQKLVAKIYKELKWNKK